MSHSLSRLIVNTGLPPKKTSTPVKPLAPKPAAVIIVGGDIPGMTGNNALNRVLLLLIAAGALGEEDQQSPAV